MEWDVSKSPPKLGSLPSFAAAARPQSVKPRSRRWAVGCVLRRLLFARVPLRLDFVPSVCAGLCRVAVRLSIGRWSVGRSAAGSSVQALCFDAVCTLQRLETGLGIEQLGKKSQFQAGDFRTASRQLNGRQTGMLRGPRMKGALVAGKMASGSWCFSARLGQMVTSDGSRHC
jgi:hypothetical protein